MRRGGGDGGRVGEGEEERVLDEEGGDESIPVGDCIGGVAMVG